MSQIRRNVELDACEMGPFLDENVEKY